jgi:hypothetical protein
LVIDSLHDEYLNDFDVAQVRGEIGWMFDCCNEWGFWFTTGVQHDDIGQSNLRYEVINQNAIYHRRYFSRGGEARLWGGVTDDSHGLVGADFFVPVGCNCGIEGGFNYVIVGKGDNEQFSDETWNLGLNVVWTLGGNRCRPNKYRPLFDVADNGSMMVTRRQ